MPLTDIRHFILFADGTATAGQPTRDQFSEIAAAGYDVVINLAMPTSAGAIPDEAEVVTSLGMEYIALPVVWEAPTSADLERFFEAMAATQGRRRFVHCAANMRVSAFLFLYRVRKLGMVEAEAEKDLYRIWRPTGWWEAFIEAHSEEPSP
ncbi:MAG: protein tyrosine phosphatase family protein [Capsulimonadales bacterium]|nr:protein tyrosine phosphatase family protein [Capsulimonadales bacterium]